MASVRTAAWAALAFSVCTAVPSAATAGDGQGTPDWRLRSALVGADAEAAPWKAPTLVAKSVLPSSSAEPASPFASPAAEPHPWSVGLRSGYTTIPNMILGAIFQRYMPVNGYFIEAIAGRKIKGFTLYTSLSVTRASADTGVWQRGPAKTPKEIALDVTFFSADALFDWEVRLHKKFAFHFGAGIGLGHLFGTISSKECANLPGACIYLNGPNAPTKDETAEGWPIYPILHLTAGVHIDLIEKLALRIDFDFRNAFGFGIGFFYTI